MIPTLQTGNSYKISVKISFISCSVISRQFTGTTGTPYFSVSEVQSAIDDGDFGLSVFINTIKGLSSAFNSSITLSSASSYSSRGIDVIVPSVVTTKPIVECSVMTFLVPISAAILNGISSSYQGVFTILGCSSSI